MSAYPLANDENGLPLELPAAAVGWLVRRHGGGKGRPASLYDADGRPLMLPLSATVNDLRTAGCAPGAYRLDAVDDRRKLLNVAAYTELRDEDALGLDVVPAKKDGTEVIVNALARTVEGLMRVQSERERACAERERAQIERERMLCENLVKLANRGTLPAASPTERLRNAVSEQRELSDLLRDQLAAERDRERRIAKVAKRRAMRSIATAEEEPSTPHWVNAMAMASPLIGVAAIRLGQQLGLTTDQVTEVVKAASQAGALVQAAGPRAAAAVDGDEEKDDDLDDDDGDEIDEDDGPVADEDPFGAASELPRNAGRPKRALDIDGVEEVTETVARTAGLDDDSSRRKLRQVVELLEPAERSFLASHVAQVPRETIAAQLTQLQSLTPDVAVQLFRSTLGGRIRSERPTPPNPDRP